MGLYPILIALVALTVAGVLTGIRLAEVHALSRRLLPFSGGLLLGIALFWILPEIAEALGWMPAAGGLIGGFLLLWLIDRYVYAVCPTCSHTHEHDSCSRSLHGFAVPLLIAAGLHSFFDGWSLAVSQQKGFESLKLAFLVGVGVHKLPEGLALGALLMAAIGVQWKAVLVGIAAQSMMLAGGFLAVIIAPHLTTNWTIGVLSVAAGAFVYLGYHAIDSEYQQRGIATAMVPALTGVVGAAALRVMVPGS
jgi:zinc transporter ZupT